MTPADPPPSAATSDVVAVVTGTAAVAVTVTAIVVTHGHTRYLGETLAAVRAQSHRPDEVVIVDAAATEATGGYRGLQLGDAKFVGAPRSRSFGAAVQRGLAEVVPGNWLWLLHDDSAPEPTALAELLRAVEHSGNVAIAGPKQRRWVYGAAEDSAGPLVEVGFTTSPFGRRMTGIEENEIDQGQHDGRVDVLAVGLAGALVRSDAWRELGGTDPELGPFGDSLDLCRRAWLADHRVIVVPTAVVRHAQASLLGLRGKSEGVGDPAASFARRRRSVVYGRLAGLPAWAVPFVWLAMVVAAPFRAAYRLAFKEPAHARDELVAPLWVVSRVGALAAARRRAKSTRVRPRSTLKPLAGTWRQVVAERRDRELARAEVRRTEQARTDIERSELRLVALRRRFTLAAVFVVLVGLSAAIFGPLLGPLAAGGRPVGGALLPASTDLGDIWRAATTGWVATGLGAPVPGDPLAGVLLVATVLTGGAAQAAVNAMVVGSLLAAGLGAWYASGALTRSVLQRSWVVLVWIGLPVFVGAVGTGRLGGIVAHAMLPWVALAVVRALGLQRVDQVLPPVADEAVELRQSTNGSLGAAAGGGIALTLAAAGAPVLFPVVTAALLVIALCARHHRRYLALIPWPAAIAMAPFWWHVLHTWGDGGRAMLLATPGVPVVSDPGSGWQLLLGQPAEPAPWFGVGGGGVGGLLAQAAPYVVGGLVVALALVAIIRTPRMAAVGWFVAAMGVAAAMAATLTTVARDEQDRAVTGWPGAGLSLAALALVAVAVRGLPSQPAAPARWQRSLVVVVAVVVTALPTAALVSWTVGVLDRDGAEVGSVEVAEGRVVPAVGQQLQGPPRAARVLSLESTSSGAVDYAALRSDGPQLVDSSVAVSYAAIGDPAVTQNRLPELVAQLATGTQSGVVDELAALGFGAVLVPADDARPARAELIARLDTIAGLERVTQGDEGIIWRVAPSGETPASWAWIEEPEQADVAVLSTGRSVHARIDPGAADRSLVLAANRSSGWSATLNGRPLHAESDAEGRQVFDLDARGGSLVVVHAPGYRAPWLVVGALVGIVYILLAVPVRRRRQGGRPR